jgi:hypothetical protein
MGKWANSSRIFGRIRQDEIRVSNQGQDFRCIPPQSAHSRFLLRSIFSIKQKKGSMNIVELLESINNNPHITKSIPNTLDPIGCILLVSSFAFLALTVYLIQSREDICQRVTEFEWDHPVPRFQFSPRLRRQRHRHHHRHHRRYRSHR